MSLVLTALTTSLRDSTDPVKDGVFDAEARLMTHLAKWMEDPTSYRDEDAIHEGA